MKSENLSLKYTFIIFLALSIIPVIFFILLILAIVLEKIYNLSIILIFILSFIILADFIMVAPFRYLLREKMMRNLAYKFGLNFRTNPPRFLQIIIPFATFKYWGVNVNNIEGTLNNHDVKIHDVPFAKSIFQFIGQNSGDLHFTFISIKDSDGNPVYESSRFSPMFKPVFSLQKILKKIENSSLKDLGLENKHTD